MIANFNVAKGKEFDTAPEAVAAILDCIAIGETQLGRRSTIERISIMRWAEKYALTIEVSAEIDDPPDNSAPASKP